MRSIKSGLLGVVVAGLVGTFAVVGCSASGGVDLGPGDLGTDEDPTEGLGGGNTLPPSNPDDDDDDETDSKTDGGKKDGGKSDAGPKDAGPPPPEPGDPCTKVNDIITRDCGKCGTQEAVCLANESGSGGKVSPYSACSGEEEDGCIPGTTETIPCGNCGTQKRTCNKYCGWGAGSCTGQPADSCTPGSVELLSAGCPANEYRQKTCQSSCMWNNVSATCSAPPTYVLVPPTAGGVNSTIAVLSDTKTVKRMPSYGTCPLSATSSFSSVTPYAYVEVRNTNPKAVTVSIYNSQAPSGPVIDTVMAAYTGTSIPTTDTARKDCQGSPSDSGDTSLTGGASSLDFAALSGTKAVTIPANSSVQVYFGAYSTSEPTGMIQLNVKTESVSP